MIPTTQRKQVGSLHKPLAAQPCCPTESSGLAAQGPPTAWAVCAWPPTDFRPCRVAPQQPGLLHTPLPLACCTSASNAPQGPRRLAAPSVKLCRRRGIGPGDGLDGGPEARTDPGVSCHHGGPEARSRSYSSIWRRSRDRAESLRKSPRCATDPGRVQPEARGQSRGTSRR